MFYNLFLMRLPCKEYKREFLDECFFSTCAENLPKNSEVLLFKHQGHIVAFMLNLYGDDDYIVLDWGVDYGYEHYRQANLYRAATLLSLDRAITLGKQRLELGITNYTPKMTLGADIAPLLYFVRHLDNPQFSKALAKLLSDSIGQPDNTAHDVMLNTEDEPLNIPAIESQIKQAQDDFAQDDIFNKVGRYFRADSMRLRVHRRIHCEISSA